MVCGAAPDRRHRSFRELPESGFFRICFAGWTVQRASLAASGNRGRCRPIARDRASARLTGWPVVVAVLGLLLGVVVLHQESRRSRSGWPERLHGLYLLLLNKYYVDELYAALIVRPLLWMSDHVLWHVIDEELIDGAIHTTARTAQASGGELRKLQSGNARSYATWVVIGAVGFTVLLIGLWMAR